MELFGEQKQLIVSGTISCQERDYEVKVLHLHSRSSGDHWLHFMNTHNFTLLLSNYAFIFHFCLLLYHHYKEKLRLELC